jgi:hypothetical protein
MAQQKTYLDMGFDRLMRKIPQGSNFVTATQNDAFSELADYSVRATKLAADAISAAAIADGAITNGKIADNAVTSGKIADNQVTNAKMAQVASQIIKGRTSASTGNVEDLTASQVLSILSVGASTYTPTLSNVANLDASTAYECQYARIASFVVVSGKVAVDPTLAATLTKLGISLPVASNLGAAEDCAGVAFASGIAGQGAAIVADPTNDRAQLEFISGDMTNQPMFFIFAYSVI